MKPFSPYKRKVFLFLLNEFASFVKRREKTQVNNCFKISK